MNKWFRSAEPGEIQEHLSAPCSCPLLPIGMAVFSNNAKQLGIAVRDTPTQARFFLKVLLVDVAIAEVTSDDGRYRRQVSHQQGVAFL